MDQIQNEIGVLLTNYPQLINCIDDIVSSYELMRNACMKGGIILTCGNGGSAADAEHIVGELMKGFKLKRPVSDELRNEFISVFPDDGAYLANNLQRGIPAISLVSQSSIISAYSNDVAHDMAFAQQVFVYGAAGDVLLCISTSGNARNVVNACKVAKTIGVVSIGLTGESGGELINICDVTIRVPAIETFRVQEYHIPIYHALCAMLEMDFF